MTPILEVEGLVVDFPQPRTLSEIAQRRPAGVIRAVDGVGFTLDEGTAFGLVGESGCGKSTLARAIVGLVAQTAGVIRFEGNALQAKRDRSIRRNIQMVFQQPATSLNPSMTVEQTLGELLKVHKMVPLRGVAQRCRELLELVELPRRLLKAHPANLSGGQQQRVAIARALAVEPRILVADEATAALDVSVQAAILNLFSTLKMELGLTLLFISHDLAVVRNLCDRVAVMYLGRMVEEAGADAIFRDARHPYTQALMRAVPQLNSRKRSGESVLSGELPSPTNIPTGCRFHPRCRERVAVCSIVDPPLESHGDHRAACVLAWPRPDFDVATAHSTGGQLGE